MENGNNPLPGLGDSGAASVELVRSLAENINHLEEFEAQEMLLQVRDRLNEWVFSNRPSISWEKDPMIASLPGPLAQLRDVKGLAAEEFNSNDVVFLQESVWLRDVARTQQHGQLEDVPLAERLFDWTVRDLQLRGDVVPSPNRVLHTPRDILLLSRATVEERGWIFVLLARQLGLDAVMLFLPQADDQPPKPWAVALLHDNDLYLFDPRLGLPIPGPSGQGVATLAQVAADDSLLRASTWMKSIPTRCTPLTCTT